MSEQETLHIWVFSNIHQILMLEQHLAEAQLWYDLLPKPTSISNDCGVVLATLPEDAPKVKAILLQAGHQLEPMLYHSSTGRYSVRNRSRSTTNATPEQGPLGQ